MNSQNAEIFSADPVEERISKDLFAAKFKKVAKELFQGYSIEKSDYKEILDDYSQQARYNLPDELNEYFIDIKFAPLFWIAQNPIINKIYNVSFSSPNASNEKIKFSEIRSFYSKWALQKNEKEKHYFAFSTLNLLEKVKNSENLIKHFLTGALYSFDKELNSPENALKNYSDLASKIDGVPDELFRREINYFAELFSGFALWNTGEYDLIKQKFSSALDNKTHGMTASYYDALICRLIGDKESSLESISKLMEYDKKRIQYAIEDNNLELFSFFLRNSFTAKVFRESNFSSYLDDLNYLVKSYLPYGEYSFSSTLKKINLLKDNEIVKFFNDEVYTNLKFISDFMNAYDSNKNIIVLNSTSLLADKIWHLKDLLLDEIKRQSKVEIDEKLSIYTNAISENKEIIDYWKAELEEKVKKFKKILEENIKNVDENISSHISKLENSIEYLESKDEFNPSRAFNNSMVYNTIISLLIFMVGGFASVFGTNYNNFEGGSMVGKIVFEGIKWGGITFLLGFIVAAITSVSTLWEKSTEKQRILKNISFMKNHKEKEKDAVRKNFEHKIKDLKEKYEKEILKQKSENEDITQEMQIYSEELKKVCEEKLETYKLELENILSG